VQGTLEFEKRAKHLLHSLRQERQTERISLKVEKHFKDYTLIVLAEASIWASMDATTAVVVDLGFQIGLSTNSHP
jgi:hypothetical protein